MLRKSILSLFALLLIASPRLYAQGGDDLLRRIDRGCSLYEFGHYSEARAELLSAREQLSMVSNRFEIERIDYYVALCDVELKRTEVESRLKKFVADYPGSAYSNELQFALGVHYCIEGDTASAEEVMQKVNYDKLNPESRDRYDLRMGYLAFMSGDYPVAKTHFGNITGKGDYADHALYYTSYMAYAEGDIARAREGFTQLKGSVQYGDLMPHYLLQLDFKEGNYRSVVEQGDAIIANTTEEQARQLHRMMSESWFQLSNYEKAVRYMELYKALGGEMGRVENYIMGYSLHRRTLYAEAAPYLREACGADDMLTQNASYHLADCYLRGGDKQNAMYSFAMSSNSSFDELIAEDALFNYGKLQYELGGGHFNEAINILTRYIERYPESERTDEIRSLLVAAYYNSHNYAAAYEAIKKIPAPDNDVLQALQKISYFNGLEAFCEGELIAAKSALAESLEVGLNAKYNALAAFWLGEIAYSEGDVEEALRRYRGYMARAPRSSREYAMAQYNVGYCYFNNNNYAQAGAAFNNFLDLYTLKDSFRADALNRSGDIHFALREFDSALKRYNEVVAMSTSERYYAEYQRAMTFGVRGDVQSKISALKAIVEGNRGDYVDAATYELGRTYIVESQYDKGVAMLERFVKEYPSSPNYLQALSDLGLAYMNLGEKSKALKYYDMVVKSAPQSSQSKSALQGIREIYIERGDADAYFDYAEKQGLESNVSAMARDSLSYAAAQKLYLDNKINEASISFKSYLMNYSNGYYRSDALFFLSDCYIREGMDNEAIETLSELVAHGRTQYSERVLEKLSSMCYKSERWEQAAKAYRQLYDETSTAATKKSAASGYIASTLKYGSDDDIMAMANDVEQFTEVTAVALRKARYAKASILQREGKSAEALEIYKVLSAETKSAEGAEARFRVIQSEYDAKNLQKAENMVYEFSDSKTPQNYWLAKAFILLGDIYMSRGDAFQARATYQSVADGYTPVDDGIVEEAKARIAKMN